MLFCYGANQGLNGPGFAKAVSLGLATVFGVNGSDPMNVNRQWGGIWATHTSAMLAAQGKAAGGIQQIVKAGAYHKADIRWIRPGVKEDASSTINCDAVTCGNPFNEFEFFICQELMDSVCIDSDTLRSLVDNERALVTIPMGDGTMKPFPRVILTMINSMLEGMLSKLDESVLIGLDQSVGVNANTGSSTPEPVPLLQIGSGAINPAGLSKLEKIRTKNSFDRYFVVGGGKFMDYQSNLRLTIPGATTYQQIDNTRSEFYYSWYNDNMADAVLGTDNFIAFEYGAAQLITHTLTGTPTWKTGTVDITDPMALMEFTGDVLEGTKPNGVGYRFILPTLKVPGLFFDMHIDAIDCVNGRKDNDGWQITAILRWELLTAPSNMYKPTDPLAGSTRVIKLQATEV